MFLSDLLESVGFPNRKPGDEFYNPKDETDTSTFVELILWPDGSTRFENPEQRDQALKSFMDKVQGKIYMTNKPNAGMLGLYIVHMNTAGADEYYVRYVKNVANPAGIMTDIPANAKAAGHGGYKFGSKVARKEAYPIKPSNVFTSEGPYSPAQIPAAINKAQGIPAELKTQMVNYLTALSKGDKEFVIVGGNDYREVHENYTGEFAAPIALIMGLISNQDVRQKAEAALLGGEKFDNCQIIFPLSATEKLVDSKVVAPNGRIVGISSKAKRSGGAAASLTGLADTIKQKREDSDFQPILKEFADVIDMIETVNNMSAEAGFIQLSLDQKIIDNQDATVIADGIKRAKAGQKSTLDDLTPRLQNLVGQYGADTDNPRYNIIYHAIAALSRQLGIKLADMDITGAVKAILNFSTMCQIYAGTSKAGSDIKMDTFKMVWPPQYEGTVVIDTAKNFTSTEIRGKLGFKFK